MNDTDRERLFIETAKTCLSLGHGIRALRIAIGLCQLGYPPEHWIHGLSASTSDATLANALRHDQAATDLVRVDRLIASLHSSTVGLERLRAKYLVPVEAAEQADGMWCRSCLRDHNYCEPVADDYRALRLCRWCRTFQRRYGRLPSLELLDRHHRGKRVSEADIARSLAS